MSLLVDPVFDALQSDFAPDTQRIAFKDIFTPLDSVPLNVRQELLEQDPFIVEFLLLLFLHGQVEFDLGEHLTDGVVELDRLFADSNFVCLDQGLAADDFLKQLLLLRDVGHRSQLHFDRLDLVAQLLVLQVLRLSVRVHRWLQVSGSWGSHGTRLLQGSRALEKILAVLEKLLQARQFVILRPAFGLEVVHFLLCVHIPRQLLVVELFQFDLLVDSQILQLCLDQSFLTVDLFVLALELVDLGLRLFDLLDDSILSLVRLFQLLLILAFLCEPLLLHLPLNLVL